MDVVEEYNLNIKYLKELYTRYALCISLFHERDVDIECKSLELRTRSQCMRLSGRIIEQLSNYGPIYARAQTNRRRAVA